MTLSNPPKNRHRVIAACIWGFCGGLSDGAPGALLPTIEAYYDISYAIVSMIWMASAVGFVIVAAFASQLDKYLGKTKLLLFGVLCQVVMYAMVSPGGPFELTVMGFFFVGTGLAVCLAQVNIFLSRMDNAATYLSYLHGGYGAGATVAPLISKSMVNAGIKWSYYYLILLGLAIFNLANFWLAFLGADEDLKPWDHHDGEKTEEIALTSGGPSRQLSVAAGVDRSTNELRMSRLSAENLEPVVKKESLMALAIKDIPTWLIALFVLFYQGGEVAMGGWVTTFLLELRSGNPETIEYVASGFWAGLTVGRLTLTHPFAKYLGGRRSVIIFLVGSIGFALLTWLVPNVIAASLFVSLCGVAIGPVYPLMITVATRHLPRKIQIVSLTIATAFGSSGGAIFPFLVGLISQFVGTYVVLPMFIGLFTACLGCWLLLPNIDRNVKSAWWHYIW
ncbi:hypothetical protein BABINDRAFT_172172 [Babjeviella inositovora NRRL Y-12698]|uniref:Major facilitator superfamily (MFS) profile domain-containing protein n=1 Tax=Babjeviella inositovora NRRL Y-12698 TaxID=984486 RepID=A0A1E3QMH9_9ASCO|nr:uncharacterized protein BABINDRAFT_172172 [Babjeviella inositovora NRRL Y-12698]ODQ78919.1 hypothetical protein BABINDRAFT_172172 [Babjeviella inositovora NRRL Y-12698]